MTHIQPNKKNNQRKVPAKANRRLQVYRNAPMARPSVSRNGAARVRHINGGVAITHREMLTEVAGTDAFEWEQHVINPGITASFPWLSAIANRFETYRFRQLSYEYVPRCPATTAGSVTLVQDFDPLDPGPETRQDAMSYAHAARGNAFMPLKMTTQAVDRDTVPKRYTRGTGQFSTPTEPRTTDLGSLFICTDGGSAVEWGEVWVQYSVDLFTPQMPDLAQSGGQSWAAPVQPVNSVGGLLRGLTKDAEEVRLLTGLNATLTDGVITFLAPYTGILNIGTNTSGDPGNMAMKGGVDTTINANAWAPSTFGIMTASVAAAASQMVSNAISATRGSKYAVWGTNAVNNTTYCLLQAIPMPWDRLEALRTSVSGTWIQRTGL